MAKTTDYDRRQDQRYALYNSVLNILEPEALADPNLYEVLNQAIDQRLQSPAPQDGPPQPGDSGLANLIGLGPSAPASLGQTEVSAGVVPYDDRLRSERVLAAADLYYICLNERIGVFQVMYKLQELFRAGALRLSDGPGAFALYRFDKHSILRYRRIDRQRAYRRVFGYGTADPGANARPNPDFHGLFVHFISETAKFWRDKRIAEVIQHGATDLSFGSIAIVQRAGLDLRNNMKNSSYGFINVLRIETSQALAEAFRVLDAPDVRAQFGAENAWDTLELVMWQYFHRAVYASTMNQMAESGRRILQWLAEPFVLRNDRLAFEAELSRIANDAERWLSAHEGMEMTRPTPPARNVYVPGPPPGGRRRDPVFARNRGRMPAPNLTG
jgi:hypothetical protein